MCNHSIKTILISIMLMLPLVAFGQDDVFKAACVKAWMERASEVSDKIEFQNFGEKYCGCAAGKSLKTDDEVTKAAQLCMSQILLQDNMDTLSEEPGLKNLTAENIIAGCQEKWNLLNPNMSVAKKEQTTAYCQCAAPKLLELNNNRDNVTDKQWTEKINEIAASCADKVEAEQSTKAVKT